MTDPLTLIDALRRPALLVRGARICAGGQGRGPRLRRLLRRPDAPGPAEAALALLGLERELEEARRNRAAGYSPARHVEVLAALRREAALLRARGDQVKASATSALRLAM